VSVTGAVGTALTALVSGSVGALIVQATGGAGRLGRRFRPPVWVHVEDDPELVWLGSPPWVGAAVLLGPDVDTAVSPPPSDCRGWSVWARGLGGCDAERSELLVTVGGRGGASVVVEGVRVSTTRGDVPAGSTVLQCPVGGASMEPRRVEVALDGFALPTAVFLDRGGEPSPPFAFAVDGGTPERFHVVVRARSGVHRWTADLVLLVDGRRVVRSVRSARRPGTTAGVEGVPSTVWGH